LKEYNYDFSSPDPEPVAPVKKPYDYSGIYPNRVSDPVFNEPVKPKTAPSLGTKAKDIAYLFEQGSAGLGGNIGYGLEKTGIAPDWGKQLRESGTKESARLGTKLSPEMQAAQQEPLLNPNYQANTPGGSSYLNPKFGLGSLAANVVPSIPSTLAMGVASAPLMAGAEAGLGALKVGQKLAPLLARTPLTPKALEASAATINRVLGSGIGAGAAEGPLSAVQNADQWGTEKRAIPTPQFELQNRDNPEWQKALTESNGDHELAKEAMIRKGENHILLDTSFKTGFVDLATGGGMFGVLRGANRPLTKALADGYLKTAAQATGSEGLQEGWQSGMEQKTMNVATKKYANPAQDVNEGVANATAVGAVSGAAMGGIGGLANVGPLFKASQLAPAPVVLPPPPGDNGPTQPVQADAEAQALAATQPGVAPHEPAAEPIQQPQGLNEQPLSGNEEPLTGIGAITQPAAGGITPAGTPGQGLGGQADITNQESAIDQSKPGTATASQAINPSSQEATQPTEIVNGKAKENTPYAGKETQTLLNPSETVAPTQPVGVKPFVATHELDDGTPVIKQADGSYLDANNDEWSADNAASPIKPTLETKANVPAQTTENAPPEQPTAPRENPPAPGIVKNNLPAEAGPQADVVGATSGVVEGLTPEEKPNVETGTQQTSPPKETAGKTGPQAGVKTTVNQPVKKQPWEMTKKEYKNSGNELSEAYHFNGIVIALREGKPVPANVMADYPDLKKHFTQGETSWTPKQEVPITKPAPSQPTTQQPEKSELHAVPTVTPVATPKSVEPEKPASETGGKTEAAPPSGKDSYALNKQGVPITTQTEKSARATIGLVKSLSAATHEPVQLEAGGKWYIKKKSVTELPKQPTAKENLTVKQTNKEKYLSDLSSKGKATDESGRTYQIRQSPTDATNFFVDGISKQGKRYPASNPEKHHTKQEALDLAANLAIFKEDTKTKTQPTEAKAVPVKSESELNKNEEKELSLMVKNLQKSELALKKTYPKTGTYEHVTRAKATTRNANASRAAETRDENKKALRKKLRELVGIGKNVPKSYIDVVGNIDYDENGNYAPISKEQSSPEAKPQTQPEAPITKVESIPGNKVALVTPKNDMQVDAHYAVVPIDQLITSHDTGLNINPAYPKEMQPRIRTAKSYALDLQNKVASFNPELVGASATTDTGAPLISDTGIVVSGNGRTIALNKIYTENKANANQYTDWLRANAEQFGINSGDFKDITNPVLVRVIDNKAVDLLDLSRKSNELSIKEMSAVEQAFADANSAPDEVFANYDGGTLQSNPSFLKAFIQATNADNIYDDNGGLSQKGEDRINAAIMAKAYGHNKIVADLYENTDTEVKSLLNGLLKASSDWIKLRAAFIATRMPDLTNNLTDAVMLVKKARASKGQTVKSLINQTDLMSEGVVHPITEQFAKLFFYDDQLTKYLAGDKVAAILSATAQNMAKQLVNTDVFGENLTPTQILDAIYEQYIKTKPATGKVPTGYLGDLFNPITLRGDRKSQGTSGATEQGQGVGAVGDKAEEALKAEQPVKAEGKAAATDAEKKQARIQEIKDQLGIVSLLDQHAAITKRINAGNITAEELKAAFETIVVKKEVIYAELNKLSKDEIVKRYGYGYLTSSDKKDRYVSNAYHQIAMSYRLQDGMFSYSMGKDAFINSLRNDVEKTTDADIGAFAKELKLSEEQRLVKQKANMAGMENPQTLEDYSRIMGYKVRNDGKSYLQARMELTPEQREAFDSLAAEKSRGDRQARADQQKTDLRVSATTTEGQIVETKHTKTGEALFVVKAADRVEKDVYTLWNNTAKRMGGYYSAFRGAGAVPGFQFKSMEDAQAFLKFIGGDVTELRKSYRQGVMRLPMIKVKVRQNV
jgi:hypothetical protein